MYKVRGKRKDKKKFSAPVRGMKIENEGSVTLIIALISESFLITS